jgi:hypothetical protein
MWPLVDARLHWQIVLMQISVILSDSACYFSLTDALLHLHFQVTRGGKRMKIVIFELVVGDIVHLAVGDQVSDFSFQSWNVSCIIDY